MQSRNSLGANRALHTQYFLRLTGIGKDLPVKAYAGTSEVNIRWTRRPVLHQYHVLLEELRFRRMGKPHESVALRCLWGFRRVLVLAFNGFSPFSGFTSGRIGILSIPKSLVDSPLYFSGSDDLLVFRSVGQYGISLPELGSFLDVKISRGASTRNAILRCTLGISVSYSGKILLRVSLSRIVRFLWKQCLQENCHRKHSEIPKILHLPNCKAPPFTSVPIQSSRVQRKPESSSHEFSIKSSQLNSAVIMSGVVLEKIRSGYLLHAPSEVPSIDTRSSWPRVVWQFDSARTICFPSANRHQNIDGFHVINCVENFHHFIEDTVPQVMRHLDECPNHTLLINGGMDCVMRQILDELVPRGWEEVKVGTKYTGRNVHYSTITSTRPQLSSGLIREASEKQISLISRAISSLRGSNSLQTPQLRVFAARRRGLHRPLLNRRETLGLLERLGFKIVFFDELNLPQRMTLLSQTKTLVAESGAAIANAYFLPATSLLVELRHPSMRKSFELRLLQQVSGLQIQTYVGAPGNLFERILHGNDAYHIDCNDLEQTLISIEDLS